jgi:hypothetical protein
MRKAAGAVTLLCLAALVGAGCGGADRSKDFRKDYNRIVREYSGLSTEVGSAIRGASGKSDKTLAAQFGRLADRVQQEVRKFQKLNPPKDAADEFDAFVAGLAKVSDDLSAISQAGTEHNARKAQAAARSLLRDAERVSKREEALRKAVD